MTPPESTSTRPYLIRALYEWCTDNGFTPYVAVRVDDSVQVPREYVKDGEIVLNVSFDATSSLQLGNDFIAIYARENGQGMAFPPPVDHLETPSGSVGLPAVSTTRVGSEPAEEAFLDASPAPAPDERVVQLVQSDENRKPDGDGDAPRPTPGGAGARPALKRIK